MVIAECGWFSLGGAFCNAGPGPALKSLRAPDVIDSQPKSLCGNACAEFPRQLLSASSGEVPAERLLQ